MSSPVPPSTSRPPGGDADAEEAAFEAREARPGRPRRWWRSASAGRRRAVVVGVVLTLLGTIVAIWWGLSATVGKPAWRDLGYDVVDARRVDVRFEVTRPPDMTLRCVVEAQEVAHGTVGRTTVTVPAGEPATVRPETTLRTTSLAVIGQVRECHEVAG